jgi:AcrR family transcriptional regulator
VLYVNSTTPVRLTRDQQRAQTRTALLDAAARVFVERGFLGASVEAIVAEAGYTRGAFYSNFRSKEELFAALLQDRVYSVYRRITEESTSISERPTPREIGEQLAAIQSHAEGSWLFRLWLEVLAHAGRDEQFRGIAAGFWSGNRTLGALGIEAAYAAAGREPPVAADHLASAAIALDIGLALQHFVDPKAVPLDLYPELYDLLFGPLEPSREHR